MSQTQTTGQKSKRRVSKKELEQSLAAAKDRVAKIEKDLKAARRKEADHQKIVLGGWLIAAMRKNPEAMERILNQICDETNLEAPKIDFRSLLRCDYPQQAAATSESEEQGERDHPGAA